MVPSNSILVLSFFILLLSSSSSFADNVAPAGSDQPDLNKFLDSLAGGSVTSLHETMQCMHKLVPCKPYLRNPATEPPPATCCEPLKEIIAGDAQCLCKFFNDPEVLDSMNITQENALKVPHACGFEADVSKCQKEEKASAPTTKPAITANDINAAADQVQSSADEKSDSTKNMIPYGITTLVVLMISSQLFSA